MQLVQATLVSTLQIEELESQYLAAESSQLGNVLKVGDFQSAS